MSDEVSDRKSDKNLRLLHPGAFDVAKLSNLDF